VASRARSLMQGLPRSGLRRYRSTITAHRGIDLKPEGTHE
jgi:hypothetical protein